MTEREVLDELKKTQNEALEALNKGNKEAFDKAIAAYDKKFDEHAQNINSRMDKIEADIKTQSLMDRGDKEAKSEQQKAYFDFVRYGAVSDHLDRSAKNAMTAGSGADGGYMVPTPNATEIIKLSVPGNPMRELADIKNISGEYYPMLVRVSGASASWVAETAARPQTSTPKYDEVKFYPEEIYANPPISQVLLEDAAFDVEGEINTAVAEEFSAQENEKFFTGTGGAGKIEGILNPTFVDDDAWAWGKLGGRVSGSATAITGDELIVLQDLLEERYQQNASWLMNKKTFTALRQLKQGSGGGEKYLLWTPEIIGGRLVNTLMGAPVVKCSAIPAMSGGAVSVLYGDFRQAYTIVDRVGVSIQRDPYTNKPYVNFYTRKRTGGGIRNYEAYKAIKMAAA